MFPAQLLRGLAVFAPWLGAPSCHVGSSGYSAVERNHKEEHWEAGIWVRKPPGTSGPVQSAGITWLQPQKRSQVKTAWLSTINPQNCLRWSHIVHLLLEYSNWWLKHSCAQFLTQEPGWYFNHINWVMSFSYSKPSNELFPPSYKCVCICMCVHTHVQLYWYNSYIIQCIIHAFKIQLIFDQCGGWGCEPSKQLKIHI